MMMMIESASQYCLLSEIATRVDHHQSWRLAGWLNGWLCSDTGHNVLVRNGDRTRLAGWLNATPRTRCRRVALIAEYTVL